MQIDITGFHFDTAHLDVEQNSLLKELVANALASNNAGRITILHDNIHELEDFEISLLELPDFYAFDLEIRNHGTPQNEMTFDVIFCEIPEGRHFEYEVVGSVVNLLDASYLLSRSQYQCVSQCHQYNNNPSSDIQENYLRIKQLKQFATEKEVLLSNFIKNQEIISSDRIKIGLIPEQDGTFSVGLTEDFEGSDKINAHVNRTLKKNRKIRSIDTTEKNGKRIRLLKSKQQIRALDECRQYQHKPRKEIQDINENPTKIFSDEVIDSINIELFSDRVKGYGLYKPKFYPFITKYESDWIPGFIVEDSDGDSKRAKVDISNEQVLEQLGGAIQEAIASESDTVTFEEHELPIKEAERIFEVASKQFKKPEKPVKIGSKNGNPVLLIYENVEDLQFSVPVTADGQPQYKLESLDILNEWFELKEHQKEGVAWLQTLTQNGVSGAMLADDMGLGKTLQLLYFIKWCFYTKEMKKHLVVAPASLLESWENEYHKFFSIDDLPVKRFYGSALKTINWHSLDDNLIALTTYETLRNNQEKFGTINWGVMVIDEAQKIKTPGTLTTNATKAQKASIRIASTGTPVENTLMDFWCLMDFCVPGLLGSAKEFDQKYKKPLENGERDIQEVSDELQELVKLFYLRRMKSDVTKDLPQKHIIKKPNEMPEEQLSTYFEVLNASQSADNRSKGIALLNKLKRVSDHPYIDTYNVSNPAFYREFSTDQLIAQSAKLQELIHIIDQINAKQEKVIVFSEFRDTQLLLKTILLEKYKLDELDIVNGKTPSSSTGNLSKDSRQEIVDTFQAAEGFNILIMSPIAAGFGLNIAKANHVVHYSRHWNPAKEDQATDRVYRIGQTKDVFVNLPMAVTDDFNTFDVVIDQLLQTKRNLAKSTLIPSDQMEISVKDVSDEVIFSTQRVTTSQRITLSNLDSLKPRLFEAFTTHYFSQITSNQFSVTPQSGDHGADAVFIDDESAHLVQAKHSGIGSRLGKGAMEEVLRSKSHYVKNHNNVKYSVITNRYFSREAIYFADDNGIEIVDRNNLQRFLADTTIHRNDLTKLLIS